MFIERLSDDEIGEYIHDVTLRNESYDSFKICSVSDWRTKLGECECRQVEFAIERKGETHVGEVDILDFSFVKEHCVFMLSHFGEEYLSYLKMRVLEEEISMPAKEYFIKQNTARLARLTAQKEAANKVRLSEHQRTLSDF